MGGTYHGGAKICFSCCLYLLGISNLPFQPKVLCMSRLLSYSIISLLMGFVSQGWHYLEVHQGHAMGKPGILEIGAVGRSKRQRDLVHVDANRGA